MNGLLLTLFGAIFCSLDLLGSRSLFAAAQPAEPQEGDDKLRIGAFNIQVFGVSKLDRAGVLPVLVNVSLYTLSWVLLFQRKGKDTERYFFYKERQIQHVTLILLS